MVTCRRFFSWSSPARRSAGYSFCVGGIALGLLSCSAPPLTGEPVQLAARWRFADARTCDNSGVSIVAISGEGLTPSVALCAQGIESAFSFGSLPPGRHTLLFEGRSPGGMPVYQARLSFEVESEQPKELEVALVFEGGP